MGTSGMLNSVHVATSASPRLAVSAEALAIARMAAQT